MNKKVGESEYDLMLEYGKILKGFEKRYLYLFSKSGFENSLKQYEDVRLITLGEMYGSKL